jgi:hypothetical protein
MTITLLPIPMSVQEIILWQLQDDSKQNKELGYDFMVDMASEFLDLGIMGKYEIGVGSRVGGDEFGNVVDFCVVEMARDDLANTQRLVAVVAAVFKVGTVL